MKGVKPDISVGDNKPVALASRSLSATSKKPGAGSGAAPTAVKKRVAAREKTEVVKKRVESILYGYLNHKITKVAREIGCEGVNTTVGGEGKPCC